MIARVAPPAVAFFLALAGCGSASDGADDAPLHDGGGPPPSGNPGPSGPGRPGDGSIDGTSCATETAAIQKAMDAAHPSTNDAVAAIKSPACGLRFFSSGPSHVDATKLHRIASVSKTYAGGVVLKLVDEGRLSLDSPASQWLTNIPGGNAVHIRHLLQHMSGLKPFDKTLGFQACLSLGCTPQQLLSYSFDQGQAAAPGSKFEYMNVNFVALSVIAEKVTGKSMATLLKELVRTPLHTEATFFAGGETVNGTLAAGKDESGRDATDRLNPTALFGAGNVVATPTDVVTWIEALGSGKFHGAHLRPEIEKFVPIPGTEDYKYGLAMMELEPVATFGGGVGRGHNGDLIPGYHTQAYYFPERQTTVVSIIDYTPSGYAQNPQSIYAVFRAILKTLFSPASN